MQRTLYWLLGSVAACTLCVAILIGLFDWNWLRAPVVAAGASGSGRRFAIDGIDAGQLGACIAGAVALGVLLTPLAAILAFIDPSLTGDSDCGELLRENPIKQ